MMNYYYATLHFIVTVGVMVWLFVAPLAHLPGRANGAVRH